MLETWRNVQNKGKEIQMMNNSRESRKEILQENYDIIDNLDLSPVFIEKLEFGETSVSMVERTLSNEVYKDYDRSRLIFEKTDTITSALKYGRKRGVDFLVFASSRHYGGGIWNGAKAQEEDIFLCTDLCKGGDEIQKNVYPLDGCMVMDCHIIRNSMFEELENPVDARAFFCPAPNINSKNAGHDFWTRMCTLEEMTFDHAKGDCLVTGAWGCGVFGNNPEYVAGLFGKAMPLFLDDYKRVVVSVPDERVLNIFKEILL